jgi:8-oxo-dGTP pyrophosphatase MutT (NUDIX family)
MNESQKTGVHAILVTNDNKIVLQQKDLLYNINPVNKGKVSMYGGGMEKGEDFRTSLNREIMEELNFDISNLLAKKVGVFQKTLGLDESEDAVHVFVLENINLMSLDPDFSDDAEAASMLVVDTLENLLARSDLTRITRMALEKYSNQKK